MITLRIDLDGRSLAYLTSYTTEVCDKRAGPEWRATTRPSIGTVAERGTGG